MYLLEPAKSDDAEKCYRIIQEAKQFQKAQGFTQWTEDYPNLETIRQDIQAGKGYAVTCGDQIAGYMCIDFPGSLPMRTSRGRGIPACPMR